MTPHQLADIIRRAHAIGEHPENQCWTHVYPREWQDMIVAALEAFGAAPTSKVLSWARPLGATMDSMRKHVWETGLASLGDTILVWVNEGDFWHLMLNGCELKEYKTPEPMPIESLLTPTRKTP
jgi:hypothetical protein